MIISPFHHPACVCFDKKIRPCGVDRDLGDKNEEPSIFDDDLQVPKTHTHEGQIWGVQVSGSAVLFAYSHP